MAAPSSPPPALITAPPKRLLFLCVHNSARSQMAEGLARTLAPADAQVWSAGTKPRGVSPHAIEAMREIGIDISGQTSKKIDDVPWREADTVVTLCGEAEGICPAVAVSVRRIHWPLPDPTAAPKVDQPKAFREIRDEIRWRVTSLWPRGE